MQPRNARACLASLHDFDFQILILQIALLLMFPLRGLAQADSAQEPEKATAESGREKWRLLWQSIACTPLHRLSHLLCLGWPGTH